MKIECQISHFGCVGAVSNNRPKRDNVIILERLAGRKIQFGGVPLSGLRRYLRGNDINLRFGKRDESGVPCISLKSDDRQETTVRG